MCQDESEEKCDRCLLPLLFVATRGKKNRGEKRNASAVDCFLKYYFYFYRKRLGLGVKPGKCSNVDSHSAKSWKREKGIDIP